MSENTSMPSDLDELRREVIKVLLSIMRSGSNDEILQAIGMLKELGYL